jgi:hypothetical protein
MLKSLRKVPATAWARKDCLLPARARYVPGYLVWGIDEPVPERPDIPVGKPLSIPHVADLLGVRRKYVRALLSDPIFRIELAYEISNCRLLLAPQALDALVKLLDWQGEGKAADAAIRLRAALAIIGEGHVAPVNVNVGVQSTSAIQVRPGYVIAPTDKTRPIFDGNKLA